MQGAERGERRGVTRAAMHLMHAGDKRGFTEHPFHVVDIDADILSGDVAAIQGIDKTTEGTEQGLGLVLGRIANDDGLAAAEVEAGHRILVGHASAYLDAGPIWQELLASMD